MKKILFYGLDVDSAKIIETVKKENEIIGFTDSFADIDKFLNYPYYKKEKLNEIEFDYIVILIKAMPASELVKKDLADEFGISDEKIFDYYEALRQFRNVDNIMNREDPKNYDGMILGCSYGAGGIYAKQLYGNWVNLALASQDMYFNLLTLKHCLKKYYHKIKTLKYLIFDMYDYNFFNWDNSLTERAFGYWLMGGGYSST